MNTTFEINLKLLQKYNSSLCKKLEFCCENNRRFELKPNLIGEFNILIDGIPVHSVTGAQEEAKELFSKLSNDTQNLIHILYGLGLGYEAEFFSEHSKGITVIFEPDIAQIKFLFENADFSSLLTKNNIFLVSDFNELQLIFSKIYKYKKEVTLNTIDYYSSSQTYNDFKKQINTFIAVQKHNYEYQSSTIFSKVILMTEKLPEKIKLTNLNKLKNKFLNMPAIVVSAGPSLHKNIEILKQYKDNAIIFSVGTALKTLTEHNITPDFVSYIESFDCSHQFEKFDLSQINLIMEPASSKNLLNYNFKNKFLTSSYEANVNHLFSELTGTEQDYFEAKGTVAYHALYSAKYLGCNPIILLGQDLAYPDGQCYAKGTIYEGLECRQNKDGTYKIEVKDKEIFKKVFFSSDSKLSDEEKESALNKRIQELNSYLCTIKSVDGKLIPTSNTYKLFCGYFEDFAARNRDIKLINASSGAYINGFQHIRLCEIDLKKVNKNIPQFNSEYCTPDTLNKNINNLIKDLKEYYNWMIKQQNLLESGQSSTDTIFSMLQKANEKRTRNMAYRLISLPDYNELTYILREYGDRNDSEAITKINSQAKIFFSYTANRTSLLIQKLEENMETLNESCNSKS